MLRHAWVRIVPPGLVAAALLVTGAAHAQPSTESATVTPTTAAAAPRAEGPSLAGFSLLALAGYGASTSEVRGMDLAPYGTTFGFDAGFTFRFGLRLGAYMSYSLGKTVAQHRDPLIGRSIDYDADTSNLTAGLALGYDVPVYMLVLRYDLCFGATSMHWDFGQVDASDVRYGDAKDPNVGFHFAPGLAVLWPHGRFEAGLGFNYFVQANGTIPSGFLGKLLVGVKL